MTATPADLLLNAIALEAGRNPALRRFAPEAVDVVVRHTLLAVIDVGRSDDVPDDATIAHGLTVRLCNDPALAAYFDLLPAMVPAAFDAIHAAFDRFRQSTPIT